MEKELTIPKKYLSYSQMRLWLDDKEKYRSRYYRGVDERKTKELFFGSEIAKGLEDGTMEIPGLVKYAVSEEQVKMPVDGVPFFAYVDSFDPQRLKFREYKTGKWPWTQEKVNNHMQLDIYSLLLSLKYGSVDDECHLDWIVTKNKLKFTEFDGIQLKAESNEIEMTGEVMTFARVITQNERDRIRFLIRSVADEISRDYKEYLRFNPSTSPASMKADSSALSGT